MAVARHASNVLVDLSGWAPRYIPDEVLRYCNSVIPEQFLFGSDYPLLSPDRWFEEFDKLELKDHVRRKVLFENACRVLDLDTSLLPACRQPTSPDAWEWHDELAERAAADILDGLGRRARPG